MIQRARLLLPLSLASLLLAGCASQRINGCESMAGPGWTPLAKPPVDGRTLLSRTEFAGETDIIWLGNGDDRLIACVYGHGLTNPGCGGSQGVEYRRQDGLWQSKGILADVCKTPPNT